MNDDVRIVQLRDLGAQIGQNVFMGPDVYVEHDFAPLLTIEDGVVLARGVCILLHDSALNNVMGAPIKFGTVTLRRNCYVGANTTILCGVEIGEQAVIGTCSLVTSDVPPAMVVVGQPARVQGTVQALAEKHAQLRDQSDRFSYLDLLPWRERRDPTSSAQAAAQIHAFLQSEMRRKLV